MPAVHVLAPAEHEVIVLHEQPPVLVHAQNLVVPSHGAPVPQPASHVPALQYPVAPEHAVHVKLLPLPLWHVSAFAHAEQPV